MIALGIVLERLGPVLGLNWSDLVVNNNQHCAVFNSFRENHVFEDEKARQEILGGIGVNLGA